MNLFSKKALYLALFMVVAAGVQSFAADLVEDLNEARRIVADAERDYAAAEAAVDAAKTSVIDAKAGLAGAEAALENARTALEVARAAEAEVLARIEAVEAGSNAATPANPRPPVPITPADRGEIPDSIRRNEYYLESERYLALAQESYNAGNYDAATEYAEEAARLARLSDEYIARQTGMWNGELPATYTVREWDVHGDCFWNIAGQPWAYNDPHRWRVLYEANKEKLPDPNNANIVEPGTVLDIPSIKGETRQGKWVGDRTYEPLP